MDKKEYKAKVKEYSKKTIKFFSNKKVQNIIIIVALIAFLVMGSWIRVQNLPLLVDQSTGEYIPTALDPYYFLRLSETILEQGSLPEFDEMRYSVQNVKYSPEILPQAMITLYKVWNIFDSDISFRYVDVVSPVVFFFFGMIVFFLLIYLLTNSKWTALISSALLSFIPSYLYRSTAGFSDHESLGMFAFFLALLCFTFTIKKLDKSKINLGKISFFGILTGLATMFAIASWGGGANFLFMIIPSTMLAYWIIKIKKEEKINNLLGMILFFGLWMISCILFAPLFGFEFNSVISRLMSSYGLIGPATLLFMFIDIGLLQLNKKYKFGKKWFKEEYRILYSVGFLIILGGIFIQITKGNFLGYLANIIDAILHPFGEGRVGLTVAENKQPFLDDWISQIGKRMFWFFYAGLIAIGMTIASKVSKRKDKLLFAISWIILITGILFSRISVSSALNGTNFMSKAVLFLSILFFLYSVLKIYFKDNINIKPELILIFAWLLVTLISSRSAIRAFFMITPFACFSIGYLIVFVFEYAKKRKDETIKIISIIMSLILILVLIYSTFNFAMISKYQAENTGPSANAQWQYAMQWVRDNTLDDSTFIHWWDYGYWVQTLGERPTVTDGGHAVGHWDHLIGRYLLTTPFPETALSLMKTHRVSYLLIDQTDLGKYSAYSSIGDGSGEDEDDRESYIPVALIDHTQTIETNNSKAFVYREPSGNVFWLDEDIVYETEDKELFLPKEQTYLIGFIINVKSEKTYAEFEQPIAIFVSANGQQHRIPLKYLQYGDSYKEFKEGLEATIKIIPAIMNNNGYMNKEDLGAAIYISPKVTPSLFAQLYLMNDPENKYSTLKLAHSEDDPVIKYLGSQGMNIGEFVYYQGFRGPIKIWRVDYPENIIEKEEFLETSGSYGELDDLVFTK